MKNFIQSIIISLSLLFLGGNISTTHSQTFDCGTGTSTSYDRLFNTYWYNGRSQFWYASSELSSLSTGDLINSIAFNRASGASMAISDVTIQVQLYNSNPGSYVNTGWTTVFNGPISTLTNGWNTINFDSDFTYTAGNGLLVNICWHNGTNWSSTYNYWYYTSISSRVKRTHTDGTFGCSITTSPSNSSWRPNTRFGYGSSSPHLVLQIYRSSKRNNVSYPSPTLSWDATPLTSYDVYFGTLAQLLGAGLPLVSDNQAGTSYVPSGFSASTDYYWKVVPSNSNGDASGCSAIVLPLRPRRPPFYYGFPCCFYNVFGKCLLI